MGKVFVFVCCIAIISSSLWAGQDPSPTWVKSASEFYAIPTLTNNAHVYLKGAKKSQRVARFIFVRHGESISNQDKSMAGRTLDVDLSERGVEQAKNVGSQFAAIGVEPDLTYSSPSLRARRTAALILEQLKTSQEVILDELLYERYYGPYEGASESQYAPVVKIEKEHCTGPEWSFSEKFTFKAHSEMESLQDVFDRLMIWMGLWTVDPQFQGRNTLVTTHNSPLKALFMADAAKRGYDVDYSAFDLENGAIVIVEVGKDTGVKVVATSGLSYREKKAGKF